MPPRVQAGPGRAYAADVSQLSASSSTTEETYYPATRELLGKLLQGRSLPFQVRIATSEHRPTGGGADRPDFALYDREDFVAVFGEVKLPDAELNDLAVSVERNDQIGRYLGRTGVVLITNIRSFGLVAVAPGKRPNASGRVPPEHRQLLEVADLWSSEKALKRGDPISPEAIEALGDLVERAVTEFAPIAEPSSLALILARQARRAKADLPETFDAVAGLLEDYKTALGLTFATREGEEFFRSSLIQTAFYSLFAGWTLWHRANDGTKFEWDRIDRYLKIPFLGKLFYEFKHPDRLAELGLAPHLDRAAATLGRVDRPVFFGRFSYSTIGGGAPSTAAAITYFYEPFVEAFDPDLRKELGVWYTPPEVVRYQVRKIDRLLRDQLNCPHGFADERVVVLDPCCGTGAYLLEVMQCIAEEIDRRGDKTILAAELLHAVTKRILGFEILTAPFVVSQLQLYMLLADLGEAPKPPTRPAVFLTNALTGWEGSDQIKLNFPELKEEHESAQEVKKSARIIVILGNPPYNRFAGIAMAEEADLVDHYKGIKRVPKKVRGKEVREKDGSVELVQDGQSLLYKDWGVVKQLLDDLYIRFFRLGEKRIAETSGEGVVSFISNSSYLVGRSHPIMRESILRNFDEVWIDNTHGNRLASERTPSGDSCETLFSFDGGAGIKVGTAISTFIKRRDSRAVPPDKTPVRYRDFWGKAERKRAALLESLEMDNWTPQFKKAASQLQEGPREYETFFPTRATRWMFSPRDENVGFEAWPALDELFPTSYQGINPNRGLDGSVIDFDKDAVANRMQEYFEAKSFKQLERAHPALATPRARYDPEETWDCLRKTSKFRPERVVPYLVFPLDSRWLYYETECKLLNERRPEYWENIEDNEFLIAVPQPRRVSETRPLMTRTLVDLHLHDRGSVCFPRESAGGSGLHGRSANLAHQAWARLHKDWKLKVDSDMQAEGAKAFVGELFRYSLAVVHAPEYERDHADSIAQDWAHLPIAKDRTVFGDVVKIGADVAALLDPLVDAEQVVERILGKGVARTLAQITRSSGGAVTTRDLSVAFSYYGAAKGRWIARDVEAGESEHEAWGDGTGDLYINTSVHFANVPERVWNYELGGYAVLKKWLGYRHRDRIDRTLSLAEARHFRSMVQRIGALLVLHSKLDEAYGRAIVDAYTAEELGVRKPPRP